MAFFWLFFGFFWFWFSPEQRNERASPGYQCRAAVDKACDIHDPDILRCIAVLRSRMNNLSSWHILFAYSRGARANKLTCFVFQFLQHFHRRVRSSVGHSHLAVPGGQVGAHQGCPRLRALPGLQVVGDRVRRSHRAGVPDGPVAPPFVYQKLHFLISILRQSPRQSQSQSQGYYVEGAPPRRQ